MATGWSEKEVEATVSDYFEMLSAELLGQKYNKAEHNRNLRQLLNQRTRGAVERKHQNISAILIELGFVPISGYKPLGNYQQLLQEAVLDQYEKRKDLVDFVASQVVSEASIPTVDNILATMVNAPTDSGGIDERIAEARPRAGIKRNYLKQEARNQSLGAAGEAFVVNYEIARLSLGGKEHLANKVERVSETRGDGLGYDVLSFETTGKERLIEVKTTAYGPRTPFWVTRNEVDVSLENGDKYMIYRAYNFRRDPEMYSKRGAIEDSYSLRATQFLAHLG